MGLILIDFTQASLLFDKWSINNWNIADICEGFQIFYGIHWFMGFQWVDNEVRIARCGTTQFPILGVTFDGANNLLVVDLSQSY